MTPNKVAILGAGFIGRNLLATLANSVGSVRVLDRHPCPKEFQGEVDWVQGVLEDGRLLLRVLDRVDVVFHLISTTVPRDSVDETQEIMSNVAQTIRLLKRCVENKVDRVIFISSASVYGISKTLPVSEDASTDPISSHGIHKLTIEKYLQLYKYKYSLDCKIMRLSNPYGFGQDLFGRQGLVAIIIGKLITDQVIRIFGDGSAVRDFLHIDDVIHACRLLASTESDEMVFNIGSGRGTSVKEILGFFRDILAEPLKVEFAENEQGDIPASILDTSRAKRVLGFTPETDFQNGLKKTLLAYAKDYPYLLQRTVLAK